MAEKEKKTPKKPRQTKTQFIGSQAKPTVLNDTTKLDIDTNKVLVDNVIEAGINGGLNISELDRFTSISNARDQIYSLIDTMCEDSSVASIVRTYAEDVCETADNGHIMWAESDNPNISKFINYLLNVMNVDKNLYSWAYSLIKYGDVYLRLYRESDYEDKLFSKDHIDNAYSARNVLNEDVIKENVELSVHRTSDPYSYYVEAIPDPGTMFELTRYGKTYGFVEAPNVDLTSNYIGYSGVSGATTSTQQTYGYRLKSNNVIVHQADDFVHACLEDGANRFPETVDIFTNDDDYNNNTGALSYKVKRGKSMLYDSYKIWREKSLLEDSVLLNRITKSSIVRTIQVEVGDMPKTQVQNTLARIKTLMEQKSAINTGKSMGEYTNTAPIENNIYLATHNGQGAVTIGSVGGDVDVKNLADVDNWTNKFYASYGIPKQYFGWTDDGAGFNGGSSLTILSSVYAKGVKKVQNALIQMISDAISLFLVNRGYRSYLNNFTIKMRAPLTQEELDYRSNLTERISAISNFQSLLSDIENKPRRLIILKDLIATLNYDDGIQNEIQKEIDALTEQDRKDKEAAEAEAAETVSPEEPATAGNRSDGEDVDLGLSSVAPIAEEGLRQVPDKTVLMEDQSLTENEDDLPSPDEIDSDIDFTQNK